MRLKKFSVMLEGTSPDVPKIFGSAEALPSRKTTRYSPLATRRRFGSAGASPSQFIPSLAPRPTPRFKLVATKTKPAEAG
jgi:hypothetical protein